MTLSTLAGLVAADSDFSATVAIADRRATLSRHGKAYVLSKRQPDTNTMCMSCSTKREPGIAGLPMRASRQSPIRQECVRLSMTDNGGWMDNVAMDNDAMDNVVMDSDTVVGPVHGQQPALCATASVSSPRPALAHPSMPPQHILRILRILRVLPRSSSLAPAPALRAQHPDQAAQPLHRPQSLSLCGIAQWRPLPRERSSPVRSPPPVSLAFVPFARLLSLAFPHTPQSKFLIQPPPPMSNSTNAPQDLTLQVPLESYSPCDLTASFDPNLGYSPFCPSGQACFLDLSGLFCLPTHFAGCILTNDVRLAQGPYLAPDVNSQAGSSGSQAFVVIQGPNGFLGAGASCSLCPVPSNSSLQSQIEGISNVDMIELAAYSNCNGSQFYSSPIPDNTSVENPGPYYCDSSSRMCLPLSPEGSSCAYNLQCQYPGLSACSLHANAHNICGPYTDSSTDGQPALPRLSGTSPSGMSSTVLIAIITGSAVFIVAGALGCFLLTRRYGRDRNIRREESIRMRRSARRQRGLDVAPNKPHHFINNEYIISSKSPKLSSPSNRPGAPTTARSASFATSFSESTSSPSVMSPVMSASSRSQSGVSFAEDSRSVDGLVR
ncbi:uncharacterized protein BJ171DRAFT_470918 [Polychytrium aggregatum]|uniref:uncharacterized protein n=1 Tax=Polychytrium aggregatum TaxID=110093 RepID=UPI0022FF1BA3|nr:uncharacterized protein BJ171DRAFT_470918 [Polychytrium aggregatum]KAI9209241.1 hypothetical protein BJ171DRAFT_470918 [Polychytrium aggregatum]